MYTYTQFHSLAQANLFFLVFATLLVSINIFFNTKKFQKILNLTNTFSYIKFLTIISLLTSFILLVLSFILFIRLYLVSKTPYFSLTLLFSGGLNIFNFFLKFSLVFNVFSLVVLLIAYMVGFLSLLAWCESDKNKH